ncbi:PIG-L deacetylase family protein [Herbaspirillum sp. YR522]|uniref:PIG-L deacetylase family protein n=1 Tax=Herbaspirillum sp. YR522 TaxID=1144342 RepID=UPI00026FB31D|nr:PIG-L deacetylase family protein [Herbaspirillum sp. YR522]EJN09529.1 putative LmbE-like protein [Herbaspirillum sp. YR522]
MATLNLPTAARFIDIVGGTAEHEWQACPALQALPELELCHLVPPRSRAVILAPHPDDETLGCGGLMARLATMMRNITVIAVSDGEGSHPTSSPLAPQLPRLRAAERQDALRCLGAGQAEVLRAGIADGRVQRDREQFKAWLKARLLPTDIVFAPWRLDGHPDHEAVGNVAAELEHELGCKLIEVPIWGWHWADPQGRSIPWGRARKLALDPASEWKKRRALRCYRSQVAPDGERAEVLPAAVLAHFVRPYEVLFV